MKRTKKNKPFIILQQCHGKKLPKNADRPIKTQAIISSSAMKSGRVFKRGRWLVTKVVSFYRYLHLTLCAQKKNHPVLKRSYKTTDFKEYIPLQATECEQQHHLYVCCRKEKACNSVAIQPAADRWVYGVLFY